MKNREKAIKMAKHAYTSVPLYVNFAEKNKLNIEELEFEQLPVLDKSNYIECGMSVLSSNYIGKYIQNKLVWGRTSGSTGKFGEVYWDKIEMRKSLFSLWCYRKKYYNILSSDKLCYFFTADTGEMDTYESESKNIMAFSRKCLYDGTLKEIYRKIVEFNPVWMILQPSIAILLCDIVQEDNLEIPSALRYIEFTGEYLEDAVRRKTEEIFGCTTANQYGAKEVNSIAFECPEGNMHIMSDNVYIEVLGDKEESGEICVTSLKNKAMPLVRFNIGDRGRILYGKTCPCGNCNDILLLNAGRENDWIQLEDGSKVHAYAAMQIMNAMNYEIDGEIIQYQIVQKAYKQFVVMLVIDDTEFSSTVVQMIQERMKQRFGADVEIMVKVCTKLLPSEKTGKLSCFISEVE